MYRRHQPFLVGSFLVAIRNLFSIAIFSLWAISLFGQDASTGALRGVVLDAQGAAITNADIVAIRVETGFRYHTATDSVGRFTVDLLPPGQYSTRAEAEGMSPQISPLIRVEVGATTQLTFKLKVGGPMETITVSEAPRILDENPSSVSALLEERAIKDLPLNGRRYTDLLLLVPGVTQDPRGLTSGSNGDLSYGGIRGYNTSFLVDGGDNNNGFFAQATGRYRAPYQFSNEVVQEFRVQSSGYGAESGRAGGAVVNVGDQVGVEHVAREHVLSSARQFPRGSGAGFCGLQSQRAAKPVWRDHWRADPARQDVLLGELRSAHFPCAGGGAVRERFHFCDTAVGHVPEHFGLRGLRSAYWGDGLRSGDCAGLPSCQCGWAALYPAQRVAGGGAAFYHGRDISRQVAGERGIPKAGSGVNRASAAFGAAEYVPLLRDEQCLPRSGESDYQYGDQREWGRGRKDRKRFAQFAERDNAAADQPFAGAVFARPGTVVSQPDRDAD